MSNTTATRTAAATKAPAAATSELAVAIAAVTMGEAAHAAAGVDLFSATRDAYARHAATYSRSVEGTLVMPEVFRADVLAAMWNEAGHGTAPAAKDRTKGERTFAQYASRFAKVATSVDYGVGLLMDDDATKAALADIAADAKSAKAENDLTRTAVLVGNYSDWLFTLATEDRDAIERVTKLFASNSVAASHGETFAAAILAITKAAN